MTRRLVVALFVRRGAEQFSQIKREKPNCHQMPREVEVRGVPVGRDSAVSGVFFFPVCAKDRPSSAESGKL